MKPKTLLDLQEMIRKEMGSNGIEEGNVDKIKQLMDDYVSNPLDWEQFALFEPSKYTRNLVDDGNGKYNLLVLWYQTLN